MGTKVVAIISQDEFIKARVETFKSKHKQYEAEMSMLDKMMENKTKDFEESVKAEKDAIENYLLTSGKVTGFINSTTRHMVMAPDEDAIYLCDHTQQA